MVLAVVLGLLLAHVADVARRGLFAPPVPGPGQLLPWLFVGFFLLLASWTLPLLWAERRRGFVRGRLVGTVAALAGLGHYLPFKSGLAGQLHRAFWAAASDRLTDFNLISITALGTALTLICVTAMGERRRDQRWATDTALAVLTYVTALVLWASPAVHARFGPGWTVFPIWPDPPLWALLPATLLVMAVAEGIFLLRPWALAGVFFLNAAAAGGLLLVLLEEESARLAPLRLAIHLLLLHWLRLPDVAGRYGVPWLARRKLAAAPPAVPPGTSHHPEL